MGNPRLVKYRTPLICLALAVATFIAFEQVRNNDFVSYDDDPYVTDNPNVNKGLSLKSVVWAFKSGHANILVIDDEESMRDSCQQTLSRDENTVEVAEDGLTGLVMLEKESFDLVILDLKMPGLNGMEVLKKLSEEHPKVAVVIITGYATVEAAVQGMRTGAYDFIPKPFTPDSLLMSVERALEKSRFRQETSNEPTKPDGEGFFW